LITLDGYINLFTPFKKYLYLKVMRPLYLITLLLSSFNFSLHGNWIQVGQELVGTASEEYFGEIVKLSSDGQTLMGMSADSNFGGEQTGLVRTYIFNGTDWDIQQSITGEEYNPITFADLSHNGILHTYSHYSKQFKSFTNGGFYSDGWNGSSGTTYQPFGLNGNGNSIVYTNGTRLSVTTSLHHSYGSSTISHNIDLRSDYDETSYSTGGPGGPGEGSGYIDLTGAFKSISMTKSGNHFAVGVILDSYGLVSVYQYNGDWTPKGKYITKAFDFGQTVALNVDGTIVAIGAPYDDINDVVSSGFVEVYQYNSSLDDWVQIGQTISGDNPGDKCGEAVAINEQGNIIAVGYEDHDGNGEDSGLVRVFQFNGSSWEQIGQDIYGEAAYDYFGESIGMNAEGTRIAISSQDNDSNGIDAGHIRVFDFIPNQEPVVTPVYELKVFKSTDMNSWDLIETRDVEASEEDLFIKAELSPKVSN
jgi:hypothetical protein